MRTTRNEQEVSHVIICKKIRRRESEAEKSEQTFLRAQQGVWSPLAGDGTGIKDGG